MSDPADKEMEEFLERLRNEPMSIDEANEEGAKWARISREMDELYPDDEDSGREFELQPDEIDDATIDELISHLEARDRYRFGGLTDGQ